MTNEKKSLKLHRLWLLLPLMSVYVAFYLGYEVFYVSNNEKWWSFPVWISLFWFLVVSLMIGVKKGLDDDNKKQSKRGKR
jgi:hypothetical protein